MNYKFKTDGPDYLKTEDVHFKEHEHSLWYRDKLDGYLQYPKLSISTTQKEFLKFLFPRNKKKPKIKY